MGGTALQVPLSPEDLADVSIGWSEVLLAAAILVVGFVAAAIARAATRRALTSFHELQPWVGVLAARAVGWTVVVIAIVAALTALGVDTAPVVLIILLVGVVVVLSGRDLLENFGAGIVIQARAPIRSGDQVELAGYTGTVQDINARAVVLHTTDGRLVHIPNHQVLSNPIVNLTVSGARRSTIEVGVAYGTDLDRAVAVISAAVAGAEGVLSEPSHEVLLAEFDESAIGILVRFWHEPQVVQGLGASNAVVRAVDGALRGAGIEVPFPQRVVWRRETAGGR